jgi:putative peptide zinc metalloprotease protein
MLQLRPTFSESWYRVASLKPRLRAGAQISRTYYRGERWYVMRDPAGNQFHRLSDAAYCFVGLLDGRRTIAEAWDLVGGQLDDDAPTQPEVIQILSQLYAANLLETDVTPDSAVLLRRHKEQQKRKMQNRLMNVLFPRIPLWDPDRFLKTWLPVAKAVFSKFGALVWLAVVTFAIVTIAPKWGDLRDQTSHVLDLKYDWGNLAFLYLTFVLIKLIHELGHAFSCRRFGGEVHELGLMFLVFMPTPYVDASTAWAFPSRWHRIFVGAAGMIVELFCASICAFVWCYTLQTDLIHELAYNAMLIASVSTILFNANPLLRYDGYYILSDFLEIPNLRQKSVEYSLGLIKRHIFRIKLPNPLPPVGQRFWLFIYAVSSGIYRIFIGVMIIVIVTYKVPVLGQLMALGGVITWLGVPLYKVTKYILLEPELERKRGRAAIFAAAVAALLVVSIGIIRVPRRFTALGVLEPRNQAVLLTNEPGFVEKIPVVDGQTIRAGDAILVLRDDELETEFKKDQANLEYTQARERRDLPTDPIKLQQDQADEITRKKKVEQDQSRISALTIRAPIDGVLVAPNIDQLAGVYLQRGQQVAIVADTANLLVKVDVDQRDAELPFVALRQNSLRPEILVAGAPSFEAPIVPSAIDIIPESTDTAANRVLTTQGGGAAPVDPKDQTGTRTISKLFEVRLTIANTSDAGHRVPLYQSGQRATVRFTIDRQPLIIQWKNRFLQLLNTQDTGKWI